MRVLPNLLNLAAQGETSVLQDADTSRVVQTMVVEEAKDLSVV